MLRHIFTITTLAGLAVFGAFGTVSPASASRPWDHSLSVAVKAEDQGIVNQSGPLPYCCRTSQGCCTTWQPCCFRR